MCLCALHESGLQFASELTYLLVAKFDERFEGLVHLSAMTKEQSAAHRKVFQKGQDIKMVIRNVDPATRKISLSLRDVENALEKIEIAKYIDKEADVKDQVTNSPFSDLKSLVEN